MAVALVGWGAGQAYWSWSEIIAAAETPFPSPADLGFLVFPAAAAVAVLLFQRGTSASRSGLRAATDGLIVATSIFTAGPWCSRGQGRRRRDQPTRTVCWLSTASADVASNAFFAGSSPADRPGRRRGCLLSTVDREQVADSRFVKMSTAAPTTPRHRQPLPISPSSCAQSPRVADTEVADWDSHGVISRMACSASRPVRVRAGTVETTAWRGTLDHTGGCGRLTDGCSGRSADVGAGRECRVLATVRQREEQLRYRAFHDPLTGLANRLFFQDRLEHAAARQREHGDLTLLYLDLDGFKTVNDRLGHRGRRAAGGRRAAACLPASR